MAMIATLLFEDGERLDQHVEGFHRPQFAEADDVGRVRARYDRGELGLADAVMHHPHDPGRMADLGAEQRCDVATLKQEKVRAPLQKPFERAIEPAGKKLDQFGEDFGMSVGKQSCRQLIGRSLSGDHVGRERPRRAAEAKECRGRRQILPHPRDRLIDWPVDQRAAMWRVDADRLWGAQG